VVKWYVAGKRNLTDDQQARAKAMGMEVVETGPKKTDDHAERAVIDKAEQDSKTRPVTPLAIHVTNRFCPDEPGRRTAWAS
jgi:hypothetical protein